MRLCLCDIPEVDPQGKVSAEELNTIMRKYGGATHCSAKEGIRCHHVWDYSSSRCSSGGGEECNKYGTDACNSCKYRFLCLTECGLTDRT